MSTLLCVMVPVEVMNCLEAFSLTELQGKKEEVQKSPDTGQLRLSNFNSLQRNEKNLISNGG